MKLRNRIALNYMVLIALFQLVVFMVIYFFAKKYTDKEFYQRLEQRVTIAAQTYLEEDELSLDIYGEIYNNHLKTLPSEREEIYQLNASQYPIDPEAGADLPEGFIPEILEKGVARAKLGDRYYKGMFYHDNEGDFIIVLSAQDLYGEGKLQNLLEILATCYLLSLFVTWILGRYLAKQSLSPISRINQKMNRISATNLHLRLDTKGSKDELTELANTFNEMLDRLETAFELQNNFINNASHELRNPLAAILGQLEVTMDKERSIEEYKHTLQGVEAEANRLNNMVDGLLQLAQTDYNNSGQLLAPLRMDELLLDIKTKMDAINPENNIVLEFDQLPAHEEELLHSGNRQFLQVALHNLMDNACKFSGNNPVKVRLLSGSGTIRIIIMDRGIGIPREELDKIFEPFYRGSNSRSIQGFGFGLALARRIIHIHHGNMEVISQLGKGTMVKISLPAVEQPQPEF